MIRVEAAFPCPSVIFGELEDEGTTDEIGEVIGITRQDLPTDVTFSVVKLLAARLLEFPHYPYFIYDSGDPAAAGEQRSNALWVYLLQCHRPPPFTSSTIWTMVRRTVAPATKNRAQVARTSE